MLAIQGEILKETQFDRDVFEKERQEGKSEDKFEGEGQAKLATATLLRRLGLTNKAIANKLDLMLINAQSVSQNE